MIRPEDLVRIGEIGKAHHLQGALLIHTDTDLLALENTIPVFLLLEGAPVPFFIASGGITRRNATSFIVKFDYVDSKEQAERLTGCELFLERDILSADEEDDIDIYDLVGYRAVDLPTGEQGEVVDVADYSGNIVFTFRIFSKEILVPLADRYIKEILPDIQTIHVDIPEALQELY